MDSKNPELKPRNDDSRQVDVIHKADSIEGEARAIRNLEASILGDDVFHGVLNTIITIIVGIVLIISGYFVKEEYRRGFLNGVGVGIFILGIVVCVAAPIVCLASATTHRKRRRLKAIKELGNSENLLAFRYLSPLLNSQDRDLWMATVDALSQLDDPRVVPTLMQVLEGAYGAYKENNWIYFENCRLAVAQVLGKIAVNRRDTVDISTLARVLMIEASNRVRTEVLKILTDVGKATAVVGLLEVWTAKEASRGAKEAAAVGLNKYGISQKCYAELATGKIDAALWWLEQQGHFWVAGQIAADNDLWYKAAALFENEADRTNAPPPYALPVDDPVEHYLVSLKIFSYLGYIAEVERCARKAGIPWVQLSANIPTQLPQTRLIMNEWCKAIIPLRNVGKSTAELINVQFVCENTDSKVVNLPTMASGEMKEVVVPIRVLPGSPKGEVPYKVVIKFADSKMRKFEMAYSGFLPQAVFTASDVKESAPLTFNNNFTLVNNDGVQVFKFGGGTLHPSSVVSESTKITPIVSKP